MRTVLALLDRLEPGVADIGHGRDPASLARVQAFAQPWTWHGAQFGAVVSWPTHPASWLRPATRWCDDADTWVIADIPRGWIGLGPRFAATAGWGPARTVAFAPLADLDPPRLAGRAATQAIRGATETGQVWRYRHGLLILDAPPHAAGNATTATETVDVDVDVAERTPCSS